MGWASYPLPGSSPTTRSPEQRTALLRITRCESVQLGTIDERCRTSLNDRGRSACPRLTLITRQGQRTEANRSERPRRTVNLDEQGCMRIILNRLRRELRRGTKMPARPRGAGLAFPQVNLGGLSPTHALEFCEAAFRHRCRRPPRAHQD